MAISIPIISEFDGKGIERAKKEFAQLEGAGAKAQYALKKAALPATAALAGLATAAGNAVKSASDLGESVNAVKVTFGKASDEILKLSDAAATSVGLSKKDFNGLAVQFASFATKIAGKSGNVADVLEKITGRAADFASVMNLDVADAAAKFQSGLAGEAEPLKKFGIDISDAAIKAYALANNIGIVTKKGVQLDEADKVLARYGAIMEQTEKTAGDFANTSDGLANSQRLLSAKMENFKATLGQSLLPVIEKVLPLLQKMADWATKNPDAFTAIAATIAAIAGAVVALNIAMALNPFTLIAAGVIAIGAAAIYAYKKFETFRNGVNFILNNVISSINAVIRGINLLPGVDIPTIPHIKNGGSTNAEASLSGADISRFSMPAVTPASNVGGAVTINVNGGDPQQVVDALRRYMKINGSIPIRTAF